MDPVDAIICDPANIALNNRYYYDLCSFTLNHLCVI